MAVVSKEVDLCKHGHKVKVRIVSFGFFTFLNWDGLDHIENQKQRDFSLTHWRCLRVESLKKFMHFA